jgi:predicted secreted Zn-dependent protease
MTDKTYVKSKELLRETGEQSQGSNFKERPKCGKVRRVVTLS